MCSVIVTLIYFLNVETSSVKIEQRLFREVVTARSFVQKNIQKIGKVENGQLSSVQLTLFEKPFTGKCED